MTSKKNNPVFRNTVVIDPFKTYVEECVADSVREAVENSVYKSELAYPYRPLSKSVYLNLDENIHEEVHVSVWSVCGHVLDELREYNLPCQKQHS